MDFIQILFPGVCPGDWRLEQHTQALPEPRAGDSQADWAGVQAGEEHRVVCRFNNMLHKLDEIPAMPPAFGLELRPVLPEHRRTIGNVYAQAGISGLLCCWSATWQPYCLNNVRPV